jgi:hypothetical protein
MTTNDLIRDMGRSTGDPEFSLNENGLASLEFDGDVRIEIEYDEANELLHLYSPVAQASDVDNPLALRALLKANLYRDECGAGAFALDEGQDEIVAYRCYARSDLQMLTSERLRDDVTALVEAVAGIRLTLEGVRAEGAQGQLAMETLPDSAASMRA